MPPVIAFPPRDRVVAFGLALNQKYRDHGRPAITAAYPFGPGVTEPLHVDGEGLLVWLAEYLRLCVNGYAHLDATTDVLAQIDDVWDPAGAPHPRPAPPVVAPPAPTPAPPVSTQPSDQPGVLDNMVRFARFYRQRCDKIGFAPDASTSHEQQMIFLRDTIIEYRAVAGDKSFVMKRASDTRPISNEVIVFMADPATGDYRRFWDFVRNAGRPDWQVLDTADALGSGSILPPEQRLVDPVSLQIIVG